ncbi:hypothetical protein C3497_02240 [Zoogloeaceae bacteirum Par-f-2]|nr:hypothetical protein B4966_02625 [Rhodocyclaceae bacterium]AVZ78418.1 hypothetical protein C3497_02240 [Zoogloeaceae bacteirum Par-f-2]
MNDVKCAKSYRIQSVMPVLAGHFRIMLVAPSALFAVVLSVAVGGAAADRFFGVCPRNHEC